MDNNEALARLRGEFPDRTISVGRDDWFSEVIGAWVSFQVGVFPKEWNKKPDSKYLYQISGKDLANLVAKAVAEFPAWEEKVLREMNEH